MMIDIGSTIRGIRVMDRKRWLYRLHLRGPGWKIWHTMLRLPRRHIWWPSLFWIHVWTPIWHEGRGPYISIGLGLFAIGRGY